MQALTADDFCLLGLQFLIDPLRELRNFFPVSTTRNGYDVEVQLVVLLPQIQRLWWKIEFEVSGLLPALFFHLGESTANFQCRIWQRGNHGQLEIGQASFFRVLRGENEAVPEA